MIGADLKARYDALDEADKAAVIQGAIAPLRGALASFARGEMKERELIAIEMAVSAALGDLFPADAYAKMREDADAALRERLSELDTQ